MFTRYALTSIRIPFHPLIVPGSEPVKIVAVNILAKQNAARQHTEKYELVERTRNTLVLRRGAGFNLEFEFNQPMDPKAKQKLLLTFNFGE